MLSLQPTTLNLSLYAFEVVFKVFITVKNDDVVTLVPPSTNRSTLSSQGGEDDILTLASTD